MSGVCTDVFLFFWSTLLQAWAQALPDHLRFTDENLAVQTNIYETASNTGAWCFAAMHVFHNSCILALNWVRRLSLAAGACGVLIGVARAFRPDNGAGHHYRKTLPGPRKSCI